MVCSPVITTETRVVQRGVGLVIRYQPKVWSAELMRFRMPNVASCNIFSVGKQTPITDAYLLPSLLDHLLDLKEALTQLLYKNPIELGDLNPDIFQSQTPTVSKSRIC